MVLTDNDLIELLPFSLVEKSEVREKYLSWLNDIDVVNSIGSQELLLPKGSGFIDDSFDRFTQRGSIGMFIKLIPSGDWVGTAKLDKINWYTRSAEIGIMIGDKNAWGRGVATRVYRLLMSYAFGTLGIHRLWGGCYAGNEGMKKVFLKLGFQEEGRLRDACFISGQYNDTILFSMLDTEYNQLK